MEELHGKSAAESYIGMETLANWARRHELSYDQFLALRKAIRRDAERLCLEARKLQKTGARTYDSIEELIPEDMRRRYERQGLLQYLHVTLDAVLIGSPSRL